MTSLGSVVDGALEEHKESTKKKMRGSSKVLITGLIVALLVVMASVVYAQGIFPGTETTKTSVIGSTTNTSTATILSSITTTITEVNQNTTVIEPAVLLYTTTTTVTLPGGTTTVTSTTYTTNTTITTTTATISCPQAPFCP